MSGVALVDSDVLIGAALESDENHSPGAEIVDGIDDLRLPRGVLTDYVYMEVVNFLTKKAGRQRRLDFLDRLKESEGFRVYRVSDDAFREGKDRTYFEHPDISLTDAVSVAFMHERSVQHLYSFDDDFDSVQGVTRLNTAADPFL